MKWHILLQTRQRWHEECHHAVRHLSSGMPSAPRPAGPSPPFKPASSLHLLVYPKTPRTRDKQQSACVLVTRLFLIAKKPWLHPSFGYHTPTSHNCFRKKKLWRWKSPPVVETRLLQATRHRRQSLAAVPTPATSFSGKGCPSCISLLASVITHHRHTKCFQIFQAWQIRICTEFDREQRFFCKLPLGPYNLI